MRLVAIPVALELADDLVDLAELRVPEYALADHDHNDVEKARAEVVAVENALTAAQELADEAARAVTEPRRFHENEDERQQRLSEKVAGTRAALAVVRSLTKGTDDGQA